MASFHSRSNSFPSQSNNPVLDHVQDQVCRLKMSQNTSTSPNSICANLASLRDLHEGINNLMQMPSAQQALSKGGEDWMNELLEASVRLIDLCGFSRDAVCSTKESVQELESSIRRSRGETADGINAFVASRKEINKMVKKSIKNMKSSCAPLLPARDGDVKAILKEAESLDLSVLKSVMVLLCGEKERSSQRSWPFLSKLATQSNRVYSGEDEHNQLCALNIHKPSQKNLNIKMLKSTEMMMQEVEEGLESLMRSVVKTRVSLLNLLSH